MNKKLFLVATLLITFAFAPATAQEIRRIDHLESEYKIEAIPIDLNLGEKYLAHDLFVTKDECIIETKRMRNAEGNYIDIFSPELFRVGANNKFTSIYKFGIKTHINPVMIDDKLYVKEGAKMHIFSKSTSKIVAFKKGSIVPRGSYHGQLYGHTSYPDNMEDMAKMYKERRPLTYHLIDEKLTKQEQISFKHNTEKDGKVIMYRPLLISGDTAVTYRIDEPVIVICDISDELLITPKHRITLTDDLVKFKEDKKNFEVTFFDEKTISIPITVHNLAGDNFYVSQRHFNERPTDLFVFNIADPEAEIRVLPLEVTELYSDKDFNGIGKIKGDSKGNIYIIISNSFKNLATKERTPESERKYVLIKLTKRD